MFFFPHSNTENRSHNGPTVFLSPAVPMLHSLIPLTEPFNSALPPHWQQPRCNSCTTNNSSVQSTQTNKQTPSCQTPSLHLPPQAFANVLPKHVVGNSLRNSCLSLPPAPCNYSRHTMRLLCAHHAVSHLLAAPSSTGGLFTLPLHAQACCLLPPAAPQRCRC